MFGRFFAAFVTKQYVRGILMKCSAYHSSERVENKNRQLDEAQLNHYQEIALEAMLYSLNECTEETIDCNNEDNRSFILGYN